MSRSTRSGALLPGLIAVLTTLLYFWLTDGWNRLATPVPGLIAIGAGLIGFGAGELLRSRARRDPSEKGI